MSEERKPVAYARKWFIDGVKPEKVRNKNNRLAWPAKMKFHEVSLSKILSDDVPLYAEKDVSK